MVWQIEYLLSNVRRGIGPHDVDSQGPSCDSISPIDWRCASSPHRNRDLHLSSVDRFDPETAGGSSYVERKDLSTILRS